MSLNQLAALLGPGVLAVCLTVCLPVCLTGCGTDAGPSDLGDSFAGCSRQTAVPASSVAIRLPASYSPQCVRLSRGSSLFIEANPMHALQGMVKHGTTPNPIAQGEPATGYTESVSFAFPSSGAFGFYCNAHGSDTAQPGTMTGVIYVD